MQVASFQVAGRVLALLTGVTVSMYGCTQGPRGTAGTGGSSASAEGSTSLRWNFDEGRRATYQLKDEQRAENTLDQMKVRSEAGTTIVTTLVGESPTDHDSARVRFTYNELSTHTTSNGEARASHTRPLGEGEADSVSQAAMRSLIGEGGIALVGSDGSVRDVTGLDQAFSGALSRLKKEDAMGWLHIVFPQFDRQAMMYNLNFMFRCLPGTDAKVGDSWSSHSTRSSQAGDLQFDTTWRLDAVESIDGVRNARISCNTSVTLPKNDGLLSSIYATVLTRGEGRGEVEFDASKGVVRSARFDTVLEFSNTAQPGKDPIQNKPYSQSLQNTITIQLLATGPDAVPAEKIAEPDMKATVPAKKGT